MKHIHLLLTFLLLANTMYAQGVIHYFHQPTGKMITAQRYEELLVLNKEKLVASNATDIIVKEIKFDIIRRNDSIIQPYDLKFVRDMAAIIDRDSKKPNTIIGKIFNYDTLVALDGKAFDTNVLKGKPTLLNAWFIGCKPCEEEMPALNDLMETYKDKVNFVAITFDTNEKVEKFLKKKSFNFKHLVKAGLPLQDLNITGYPNNIFLDKNNVIVADFVPVMNYIKKDGTKISNDVSALVEYLDYLIEQ